MWASGPAWRSGSDLPATTSSQFVSPMAVRRLALAGREDRLVITMDLDFGTLVYQSHLSHAGVLLLRLEAATGPEKTAVVEENLRTARRAPARALLRV